MDGGIISRLRISWVKYLLKLFIYSLISILHFIRVSLMKKYSNYIKYGGWEFEIIFIQLFS